MAKRTVEIEDSLSDNVDSAIEDVKQALLEYLEENPDTDETPDIGNDLDYSGRIHEIIDSSVPIYTSEIEDTWYLYASELEEAYEDAGVGDNPRENNGMAAIYYYIDQKVHEWYSNNADDIFEEWQTKNREGKVECEECGDWFKSESEDITLCEDCRPDETAGGDD